jgi:hypothetical protein
MRCNVRGLAGAFGLLALAASPVVGHHSFDVQFDTAKTRDLKGVITKVDWINPHAYLHLNVVEEDGSVVNFKVEMGPPYAVARNNNECCGGWSNSLLKVGSTVTIENAALDRTGKPEAGATRDTWLVVPSHKEKLTLR